MTPLGNANKAVFARYERLLEGSAAPDPLADDPRLNIENLLWMCREVLTSTPPVPDDKASRWLGFVQGCLAMRGMIDVDAEREFTRPIFHKASEEMGFPKPKVRERD